MSDRWAVVTGAAGGIGSVIAQRAATDGYRVAAWDVNEAGLGEVKAALGESGITAVVDVTDEPSISSALGRLPRPPALLVNCAGVNEAGSLLEITAETWRRILDVNTTGTFLCSRLVARSLTDIGGAIVNISSLTGVTPGRNTGSYSASKAAVIRLTEQMAVEWARHGIRVNSVAPGMIAAGLTMKTVLPPEIVERRNSMIPLGRPGLAEDIAAAVMFLGSDDAAYITGENILVDGGLTKIAVTSLPTRYD